MIVGLLEANLHLPGSRSLKDKRQVMRSLKDRLKNLGFSVAETGDHELWGNLMIGASITAAIRSEAEARLDRAVEMLETHPEATVVSLTTDAISF